MELKKIKQFIKFMDTHNLCELEIEEEGQRIKLKKNLQTQQVVGVPSPTPIIQTVEEPAPKKNTIDIDSPMVGTFYSAAAPGAKPYVTIGDVIHTGDVICIIEAMKLMNEIKSEVTGKIVNIPVENGEAIEFGQHLFELEVV
ncbi:MAG: acetyl-CoA carboxylase biotin carboxyl carrier protein [Candidatus Omnitrophica bacterium]|nr:acetyl-CoA carboxylase biotin carboxyl carrier protein [Candidatus Omnitrophota bacterium]MCK5394031.1 acetyl-CoA carboxylase biotin carboxyl carrier protein [Candidatus Omnitrophota bacterium]